MVCQPGFQPPFGPQSGTGIDNANTRGAYRNDVGDFVRFIGVERPEELREVTRAHVLRWRKRLEDRLLSPASIRRRLSSLSALFNYLCERNAIEHNPVMGVKRPNEGANEAKTPTISDTQARQLLDAPRPDTLKGTHPRQAQGRRDAPLREL